MAQIPRAIGLNYRQRSTGALVDVGKVNVSDVVALNALDKMLLRSKYFLYD